MRYRASTLKKLPTIREEFDFLLKIETGTLRVWLAKYQKEDGMWGNNVVTIEKKGTKDWFQADQYEAED